MRTLILMRHATAAETADSDYARPLTADGRLEARLRIALLREHQPTYILASSALRTAETAAIIASGLHYPLDLTLKPALYQASAIDYLPFITPLSPEHRCVLVIGHNPAISQLSDYLTETNGSHLAPAGLCLLQGPNALGWDALHRGTLRLLRQH